MQNKGKPYMGTIQNWMIEAHREYGKFVIVGEIQHPTRSDVGFIRTSSIQSIHFEAALVITQNSIYKLGNQA